MEKEETMKTKLIVIAVVTAAAVLGLGVAIGWAATSGDGNGSMMRDSGYGAPAGMYANSEWSMPMDADDMRSMHGIGSNGQMPMDADDMRDMHGDDVDVDRMVEACREAGNSTSRGNTSGMMDPDSGMMDGGSGMMGRGSGMMGPGSGMMGR